MEKNYQMNNARAVPLYYQESMRSLVVASSDASGVERGATTRKTAGYEATSLQLVLPFAFAVATVCSEKI